MSTDFSEVGGFPNITVKTKESEFYSPTNSAELLKPFLLVSLGNSITQKVFLLGPSLDFPSLSASLALSR